MQLMTRTFVGGPTASMGKGSYFVGRGQVLYREKRGTLLGKGNEPLPGRGSRSPGGTIDLPGEGGLLSRERRSLRRGGWSLRRGKGDTLFGRGWSVYREGTITSPRGGDYFAARRRLLRREGASVWPVAGECYFRNGSSFG